MDRQEIINQLQWSHQSFNETILSLKEPAFCFSKPGKWNAGQTLDHVYKAVYALNLALKLPKPLFEMLYGKANRPSKEYDALVSKYIQKLAEGGRASGRYLPVEVKFSNRQKAIGRLQKSINSLSLKLASWSEAQLDYYILPHPLLGKITIREMMYFTIYHVQHHRQIVIRDLESI